jgi:hypothetical protein
MTTPTRYRYRGPAELRDRPATEDRTRVDTRAGLDRWLAGRAAGDRSEPFTFVVDVDGTLWLAPRRSEHVGCAGGGDVLAAGEMRFAPTGAGDWVVDEVSNQSTGYCPDLDSWSAVASALDRAGVGRPDGYTHPIVFRACPTCTATNVVRDGDYVCAVCGDDLPDRWNLGEA